MSAPKRPGGRPGVGKDGAAGVVVQAIVPKELAEQLDEWATRNGLKRGPALRRMVEAFTGLDAMTQRYLQSVAARVVKEEEEKSAGCGEPAENATRRMKCTSCGAEVCEWAGLMCPFCDRTKCDECCRHEAGKS